MQPERVRTSIELLGDLYRRIHEVAAQQLIVQSIEAAVLAAPRHRLKKRLSLDEPLVPPTGKPIHPTDEQLYGGLEFP